MEKAISDKKKQEADNQAAAADIAQKKSDVENNEGWKGYWIFAVIEMFIPHWRSLMLRGGDISRGSSWFEKDW